MTPDLTVKLDTEQTLEPVSTAGMTTKVVKGSLWTLIGTVFPLALSFFFTPIVIRLLGPEAYGVLLLVGLIPTYFSFADFGMAIASTKFGSEAYGKGDGDRERATVWTATLIATVFSVVVLSPVLFFPGWVISQFSVPDDLRSVAATALFLSAISFILSMLSTVLDTPQLARLRMDLNMIAMTLPKVLMALATPLVLYLGGSIAEVVWVGLAAAILSLTLNVYFSSRLLKGLLKVTIDTELIRPLFKFGAGWFLAIVAMALLGNIEKLVIAKFVSVEALAYYSVAYTVAGMITLFSIAIRQSLLPAFAQLSGPENKEEFEGLVRRGMRLMLIILVPGILLMCVAARPFFTIWAGADFGRESTVPFYILAFGLFFSVLSYLPHSAIISSGRTDVFARLYWIELVLYTLLAAALVYEFGIVGAAIAWTLRVIADSVIIIIMAKRLTSVSFGFGANYKILTWALIIMSPLAAFAIYDNFSPMLIGLAVISMAAYAIMVWRNFVDESEKTWMRSRLASILG